MLEGGREIRGEKIKKEKKRFKISEQTSFCFYKFFYIFDI